MKLPRRQFLHLAAGAVALPAGSHVAEAQTYPTRPIRLVVGSAPGGVHDVIARLWADGLKKSLGTIVIDNRGGGGGTIGMMEAARSPADGYTLFLGSNSSNILAPLFSRSRFDPNEAFVPITVFSITSTAIAVHPSLQIQSLKELINAAKARPGKLSFAYANVGSISHVASEMFKQLAGGLDILPVPYKGMGPAQMDVVNGTVSMFVPNITGQVIGLHDTGQIRILCVNAPTRHPGLPTIPTSDEAGLPGMITLNFFGIFAPAGTPQPILDGIHDATQTALADKEFQTRLTSAAFDPLPGLGPEKAKAYVADEFVRWRKVVETAGIKVQ